MSIELDTVYLKKEKPALLDLNILQEYNYLFRIIIVIIL